MKAGSIVVGALSRREKERKSSLDALGKIAFSVGPTPPAKPPAPRPPAPPAAPKPKPLPRPQPASAPTLSRASYEEERRRAAQAEERRAKLEEERMLRERRQNELHRSRNLEWRGMDLGNVPTSIRRTGFDRVEPPLPRKISDVLGDPREKEGRAKNRDKGRRHGGR